MILSKKARFLLYSFFFMMLLQVIMTSSITIMMVMTLPKINTFVVQGYQTFEKLNIFYEHNINNINNIVDVLDYNSKLFNSTFENKYNQIEIILNQSKHMMYKSDTILSEWNKIFLYNAEKFSQSINNFDNTINKINRIINNTELEFNVNVNKF